jgi:hypothetical protein
MKECKVVPLTGRNSTDYASQINGMLQGGYSLIGSFGKNNMILVFSRNIQVSEDEE